MFCDMPSVVFFLCISSCASESRFLRPSIARRNGGKPTRMKPCSTGAGAPSTLTPDWTCAGFASHPQITRAPNMSAQGGDEGAQPPPRPASSSSQRQAAHQQESSDRPLHVPEHAQDLETLALSSTLGVHPDAISHQLHRGGGDPPGYLQQFPGEIVPHASSHFAAPPVSCPQLRPAQLTVQTWLARLPVVSTGVLCLR